MITSTSTKQFELFNYFWLICRYQQNFIDLSNRTSNINFSIVAISCLNTSSIRSTLNINDFLLRESSYAKESSQLLNNKNLPFYLIYESFSIDDRYLLFDNHLQLINKFLLKSYSQSH